MEQQFILRLPDALRSANMTEMQLEKVSEKSVFLRYKEQRYPGIICRLPCIVESQKFSEGNLCKIADISTLIVIYEEQNINVDEEISKVENNGLTPPMTRIKEHRRIIQPQESVEEYVTALLERDAQAVRVEVNTERNESLSDIDELAAELENDLPSNNETKEAEHEEYAAESAPAPRVVKERATAPRSPAAFERSPERAAPEPSAAREAAPSIEPAPPEANPALRDLEERIAEKEAQYNKTLNPILKKRFAQALEELKAEYKKMQEELN